MSLRNHGVVTDDTLEFDGQPVTVNGRPVKTDVDRRQDIFASRDTSNLTSAQITQLISEKFAPYATKSYVAERDALNATADYVLNGNGTTAGDITRLDKDLRNVNSGVAGLDATGKVDFARVPDSFKAQNWPRTLYTPPAYPTSTVTSTGGTEVTLVTHTIPYPGYSYKLLVAGHFDTRTLTDGQAPVIRTRLGSASGPIIAEGRGRDAQSRYGVDDFNRVAPALGSGWQSVITGGGSGHVETDGSAAYWVPDGLGADRTGFFRKVNDFAVTVDEYQEVYYRVAAEPFDQGPFGVPGRNWLYGRVNTGRTHWVGFKMDRFTCSLEYANGGGALSLVGNTPFQQLVGDEIVAQFGHSNNRRRFRLLRNGAAVIDYTDNANVTTLGSSYRGWGFGMTQGVVNFVLIPFIASLPAAMDYIALRDPLASWSADPETYSPAVLMPTPMAAQSTFNTNTTLVTTLRASGTGTVYASNYLPRMHVTVVPV